MIPKKKPILAMPRSRFMKAKPNVKAGLKSATNVEKKESEIEKNTVTKEKEADLLIEKKAELLIEKKELENPSDPNDSNGDSFDSNKSLSTNGQKILENTPVSELLKNMSDPDNSNSSFVVSNGKESTFSPKQTILGNIPEPDNSNRKSVFEEKDSNVELGKTSVENMSELKESNRSPNKEINENGNCFDDSVEKINSIEDNLSISRTPQALIPEIEINNFQEFTINDVSLERNVPPKSPPLILNLDEIGGNSPRDKSRDFEITDSLDTDIENYSMSTESPENPSIMISPTKAATGNLNDKSSKYPCLTKILAGPKKRLQSKEISERKKKLATFKELPPRSQMTFTDLIYWNPSGEPMKTKEVKRSYLFSPEEKAKSPTPEEEGNDDEENTSLAPKLYVNENGEIIIDESSLTVKRKKTAIDMSLDAIVIDDNVTYGTFRRKTAKQWTPKETVNFYKALSIVGTDFALMENMLPNRTRRELKHKFKKEEKINMELLHRAMYETDTFQSTLGIDDFDLDVIDIPGLEEHIGSETLDPLVGKKRGRKKRTEDSSEIAPIVLSEQKSAPTGKKRGRKKKTEILAETETDNVLNKNIECIEYKKKIPRNKKLKIIDLISESSNPDDDLDVIDNEDIFNEQVEDSPLFRKRKLKVLSQDSLLDEASEDMFEIQVQLNSCMDEESNILHSSEEQAEIPSISDEIDANTIAEEQAEIPSISDEIDANTIDVPCADIVDASVNIESDKLPLNGISSNDVKIEDKTENRRTDNSPFKAVPNDKPENGRINYRRTRRLKVNPNINVPKKNDSQILLEDTRHIAQTEFLPIQPSSPESLSIIEITDEKLLSDCVTDVVTTTRTKTTKKQKPKPNIPQRNRLDSTQIATNRLLPSSLNYTPVPDSEVDKPLFSSSKAKLTYSRNKTEKPSPQTQGLVSSLQVPVISPERSSKVTNVISSPFVTSLNVSSNQTLSIPITPDKTETEQQNIQMVLQPSPSGKSLHFYWCNNSSGEMSIPEEVPIPPVPLAIDTEEV